MIRHNDYVDVSGLAEHVQSGRFNTGAYGFRACFSEAGHAHRFNGEAVEKERTTRSGRTILTEDDTPSITPYRWTCPICHASKAGIAAADENVWIKAVGSLKTHIRSQSDDEHGPLRSLPPGLKQEDLLDCIEISTG